jgi:phenylpropionate dioxygenase-like ring-hydroxylating dioxygenase large terminal subunit
MAVVSRDPHTPPPAEAQRQPRQPSLEDLHEQLRRFWHPVSFSHEVRDRPVAARLLDVPIVLWRSQDGTVVAMHDTCLHRGTALSIGWVDTDKLVCKYHGWSYESDGVCSRIPSLPPDRPIPRRARVETFLAQERYGLVWVCLDAKPIAPLPAVPQLGADGWATTLCGPWPVNTHASRCAENFLDLGHTTWVHPGLINDAAGGLVPPYRCEFVDGEIELMWEYEEPFPEWKAKVYEVDSSLIHNGTVTIRTTGRVKSPFFVQHFKVTPVGSHSINFAVQPVSPTESIAYLAIARDVGLSEPPDGFRVFQELLWDQDREILENQHPKSVPLSLKEEMHVSPTDVVNVAYRRYLIAIAQGGTSLRDLQGKIGLDTLETDR